jgi:hypothetical protein
MRHVTLKTSFKWDDRKILRIFHSVRLDLSVGEKYHAPDAPEAHLANGVEPTEVWSAVERVRRSRAMSGCHRLVQLLTFVVGSTVRGDATHLKETTIGVAVFGRSPDYDPKVDTIVRSQAWRLRSKLKKYYATEGTNDPLVIEIPIGHYVPVFHVRENVGIG